MCCLPMVINADVIKLKRRRAFCLVGMVFLSSHDTTPSLLMCPRQLRHTQPRLCTTFGRTAPIGNAETDRSTGRSHRLTCQGPAGSRERFAEPTARKWSTHAL